MTEQLKRRNGTTFDTLANDLIDNFFTPVGRSTYNDYSYVEREDDTITVYINASGLGKEDITIKTRDSHLIITSDVDEDVLTPLVRNIGHRYRVPKEFDIESVKAKFNNGILTISLTKDEEKTKETVIDIE